MHLLHFVCALNPTVPVLEFLLETFPDAIFVQSRNSGIIPLMIASGSNASSKIIQMLLKHDTSSDVATLRITDSHGFSAVHWACREDVSSQVMWKLLLFDPSVAKKAESHGNRHKATDVLFPGDRGETLSEDQDVKLKCLLLASLNLPIDELHFPFALHASIALNCRYQVWHHLLTTGERYSSKLGFRCDPFGNLPLHYAIQQRQYIFNEPTNQQGCGGQLLERLLNISPEDSSIRNGNDEFPLSTALKSGYVWDKGIKALFHAYLKPTVNQTATPDCSHSVWQQVSVMT